MILKVFLTKPEKNIPIRNQKEMNSFIHKTIGVNNKYHDSFSDYSISSIQGGKLVNNNELFFKENPYIVITSDNYEFLNTISFGLMKKKYDFFGCKVEKLEYTDFCVGDKYDRVHTLSPILLKNNNKKITIKNDNWVNFLTENCKKKLGYIGIEDDTFSIEIKPEKLKQKLIYVGDTFNICTSGCLIIHGSKKARKALYNLGLGNSTGSGFGAVEVCQF